MDDARIEQRIDQVENQRRKAYRDDHEEDNSLHEEEIGASDALEKQRADAGITEHYLDEHGPGDELSER